LHMHALVQSVLMWYFAILDRFGLLGVVVLMAMESTAFPVPSELVVPPAAYLESHAKGGALPLTLAVVLAGTLGSYLGSTFSYWLARWVGRPLIVKYGKYVLVPESKLRLAEEWVEQYGAGGVFFARLVPVVRHLVSIPAGLTGMRFRTFSTMTVAGSTIWCTILTIFGLVMADEMRAVVSHGVSVESATYQRAFQELTIATVAVVAATLVSYVALTRRHRMRVNASTPGGSG